MAHDGIVKSVGIVGYGEVGRILAEDLRAQGVAVCAFDLKLARTADPATRAPLVAHAQAHGVSLADSHATLAAGVDLILSAVTASQAVPVIDSSSAEPRCTGLPTLHEP